MQPSGLIFFFIWFTNINLNYSKKSSLFWFKCVVSKVSFYCESYDQTWHLLSLPAWQQEQSAWSSSSVAAYNSSVHQKKKHDKKDVWRVNMGSNLSGMWRILDWENWSCADQRQQQVELFFVFFLFLSLSSQCVRDGCGLDASLFSIWIRGLASYQHELPRAEKLISMLKLTLEGGPWRKGRDCYLHCYTLWQSFGLLHSKSWESVSGHHQIICPSISFLWTICADNCTMQSAAFLILTEVISRLAFPL